MAQKVSWFERPLQENLFFFLVSIQFKHTFDYALKLLENAAVTRLQLFKERISYPADKPLTTG